jgi:hypothetical protein
VRLVSRRKASTMAEQLPRQGDGHRRAVDELERALRAATWDWPNRGDVAARVWAGVTERRIAHLERQVRRLDWLLLVVTLIAVAAPLVLR